MTCRFDRASKLTSHTTTLVRLTPTTLVMAILQMNAASGLVNPLVEKNVCTDSRNGGSFSPLISFSSSEVEGGNGGLS